MQTSLETIKTKPMIALRDFFSTTERPVSMPEFSEFWKACSAEEKDQMRNDIQKWNGTSHFIS